MPLTTIALPQDPSSPSGRNTVIYMVRNKNNLEDLRLRRRIEEYNKQLGFRVKSHDFEKLDTYEFLRQLKDCDSDKLSHFKEIQDSIRAMPTPDSMDVVNFSTAIQSLNLAISGPKTELPLLKKNVTNNSKSKIAREEGEKLPNIIKRAKTEPSFNYSLLQTKVSRSGSVFKAPTPAWKPTAVPVKEAAVSDDDLLMPHALTVSNKKILSAARKSVFEVSNDLEAATDQVDKPTVGKSVRLISGKRVVKAAQDEYADKGQGLSEKEKRARMLSRRSHGQLDISDTIMKKLICVSQHQIQTSNGPELNQVEGDTLPPSAEQATMKQTLKSTGNKQKRLLTSQTVMSRSKDSNELSGDEQDPVKSSPMFSHSTSLTKSISSISKGMVEIPRENRVPQKLSLPTLLSLGLGKLKNPKHYKYVGIQYARTRARSSQRKEVKEGTSESASGSEESDTDDEEEQDAQESRKRHHTGRGRHQLQRKKAPVEVRMQNFFLEVDKLVEKPEKVLVI